MEYIAQYESSQEFDNFMARLRPELEGPYNEFSIYDTAILNSVSFRRQAQSTNI